MTVAPVSRVILPSLHRRSLRMNDIPERIESLKQKMYSRTTVGLRGVREHDLSQPEYTRASQDWNAPPVLLSAQSRVSWVTLIFIAALIFFVAAGGFAAYKFFAGGNVVSSGLIDITATVPTSVGAGETFTYQVSITNRNPLQLQGVDLVVEYPDGARQADNPTQELSRVREHVDTVAPGQVIQRSFSGALYGAEGAEQEIKLELEYRVPDSNATYFVEKTVPVIIRSTPLSVALEAPAEAQSNQPFTMTATVKSNSEEAFHNVVFTLSYPPGFSVLSTDPPANRNSIWVLGDLLPGQERTIVVRGSLAGEDQEQRVFHYRAGIADSGNPQVIATALVDGEQRMDIHKPFVGLSLALNGSPDSTIVVKSGEPVRADVHYVNNLPVAVSNVRIALHLNGAALNESTVSVERGFYRSTDNVAFWDQTTLPALAELAPGAEGTISLSFNPRSLAGGITSIQNPHIDISADVSGIRAQENNVPEQVQNVLTRTIKVRSDVQLQTKLTYYDGPFGNTGPLPPVAERETTYTVTWTVVNGSNDVRNATVRATLPAYVRFANVVGPAGQKVTFNPVGGVLVWDVGDLLAGQGYTSTPREVSFQIAFTPSVTQVGSTPNVVGEAVFAGLDRFTNTTVSFSQAALSTRLSSDSKAKHGDDTVVR